jgi:hypothetical protein
MAKWPKGKSGNPHGRPTGSINKSTKEIREILDSEVDFTQVVSKLEESALGGSEVAARLLLEYRFGKPKGFEEVAVRQELLTAKVDYSKMSTEELTAEALRVFKFSNRSA